MINSDRSYVRCIAVSIHTPQRVTAAKSGCHSLWCEWSDRLSLLKMSQMQLTPLIEPFFDTAQLGWMWWPQAVSSSGALLQPTSSASAAVKRLSCGQGSGADLPAPLAQSEFILFPISRQLKTSNCSRGWNSLIDPGRSSLRVTRSCPPILDTWTLTAPTGISRLVLN